MSDCAADLGTSGLCTVDFAALQEAESLNCFQDKTACLIAWRDEYERDAAMRRSRFQSASASGFLRPLAAAVSKAMSLILQQPVWTDSGGCAVLDGMGSYYSTADTDASAERTIAGYRAVQCMMSVLTDCLNQHEFRVHNRSNAASDGVLLKLAQEIAASGLLQTLSALCDRLSAAFDEQSHLSQAQQQQQQQHQQYFHDFTAVIASDVLLLVVAVLQSWPGKWFTGRVLAPVLPSLLRFLLAMAKTHSRLSTTATGITSHSSDVLCRLHHAVQCIFFLMSGLVISVNRELEPLADAWESGVPGAEVPGTAAAVLAAPGLQELLLLLLAAVVGALQQLDAIQGKPASGSTSVTDQQQRQQQQQEDMSAAQDQLLRQLGMQCDCPLVPPVTIRHKSNLLCSLMDVMASVVTVAQCQAAAAQHVRPQVSAAADAQQQQLSVLITPAKLAAVMRVMIGCTQLQCANIEAVHRALLCIGQLFELLWSGLREAAAAAGSGVSGSASGLQWQLLEVKAAQEQLAGSVLLLLAPTVWQAAEATDTAAEAAAAAPGVDATSVDTSTSGVNEGFRTARECMRMMCTLMSMALTGPRGDLDEAAHFMTVYKQNPSTVLTSLEAGLRWLTAGVTETESGHDSNVLGQLIAACTTGTTTASSSSSSGDGIDPRLLDDLLDTPNLVAQALSVLRWQLALHGLQSTTAARAASPIEALQQQTTHLLQQLECMNERWPNLVDESLDHLMHGKPPSHHGDSTELLLLESVSRQVMVDLFKQGFGAQGEIGQQLVDLGTAVCAAVPMSCGCNNPSCGNVAVSTELVIASGKKCVCGGCEVARYCGRECQAAHWQQHKAACKRFKAAKTA